MSFEDLKEHLLKQDDRHKSNREIPVGNGEIKTAPSYDVEVAFGSSSKDSTAEEIIKQDDRHAPNHALKPSGTIDQAPNYDHETAFSDDGM
jgi:hypothetical protein